jgi:hypothetical protein
MLPLLIASIRNKTLESPFMSGAKLATTIEPELGIDISRQTIDSVRRRLHFRYASPRRRPMLSATQRQKRVDFCRNALDIPIDWASEVISSDEPRFGLFDDSRRRWIPRGEYPD